MDKDLCIGSTVRVGSSPLTGDQHGGGVLVAVTIRSTGGRSVPPRTSP
ncbi:hypothetical protein [Streptomyces sp. NPDC003247]